MFMYLCHLSWWTWKKVQLHHSNVSQYHSAGNVCELCWVHAMNRRLDLESFKHLLIRSSNSVWSSLNDELWQTAFTHPHAILRIFQPHRSCTALGYMVDSLETFVTPQKNSPPVSTTLIRHLQEQQHTVFYYLWTEIHSPISLTAREQW